MRSSNFVMVRRPSSGGQRTEGQCLFVRCCFRKDVGLKQSHFPSGWVGGLPYARKPRSEEATRRGSIRRMWTGSILVSKRAGARPGEISRGRAGTSEVRLHSTVQQLPEIQVSSRTGRVRPSGLRSHLYHVESGETTGTRTTRTARSGPFLTCRNSPTGVLGFLLHGEIDRRRLGHTSTCARDRDRAVSRRGPPVHGDRHG